MRGQLAVKGTADKIRHFGDNLAFTTLPAIDRVLQVTATRENVVNTMKTLVPGAIALYQGVLEMRPPENINQKSAGKNPLFELELQAENIDDVIIPQVPAERIQWDSVRRSNHFNTAQYLEVTRLPEYQRLMGMRSAIQEAFLELFTNRGYANIAVPSLTASVTESGAEVFSMDGQAGKLSLVQSPQQMKQMMAELYGAVVWTGSAFRNDPSTTRWHLAEFTGLDIEKQVHHTNKDIALQEVMNELTDTIGTLHGTILRHPQVLRDFKQKNGSDAMLPMLSPEGIPAFTYKEAMAIASRAHIHNWTGEWDRAAEKAVADFVAKTYKSDYYFVTKFPFKEKVFYTDTVNVNDPETETYSFDLVCRGVEISSGGLRVNDVDTLLKQMRIKGIQEEQVGMYLQHFKRGAAQTGGFGIGLERYMALVLDSTSRLMAPFPKNAEVYIG